MTRRELVLAAAAAAAAAAASAASLAACSRGRAVASAPREVRRVVSLSPAATEALFAIGAGDRVVGRSRYCDFPPEAARLPVVGGYVDADLEAIVQLQPDLVIGASGAAGARLAGRLAAHGIATWSPDIDSIASVRATILELGERTGHAEQARHTAAAIDRRLGDVERSVAGLPAPRVVMVLGTRPIVVAGPKSFVAELVARARAVDAVVDGGAWQVVGLERLVELDPDVVVDASDTEHDAGASPIAPDAAGWRDVRAVRDGRVVRLTDERVLRPGPRVAEGLATLARALHPGAPVPAW